MKKQYLSPSVIVCYETEDVIRTSTPIGTGDDLNNYHHDIYDLGDLMG